MAWRCRHFRRLDDRVRMSRRRRRLFPFHPARLRRLRGRQRRLHLSHPPHLRRLPVPLVARRPDVLRELSGESLQHHAASLQLNTGRLGGGGSRRRPRPRHPGGSPCRVAILARLRGAVGWRGSAFSWRGAVGAVAAASFGGRRLRRDSHHLHLQRRVLQPR